MEEHKTIEQVKARQGIFSKIQNFFTLGYGTKEDLRELDKKLRDLYYMDLKHLRHIWQDIYLEVLEAGIKVSKLEVKKIIQVLDRVMEKINHADYGYAGLFDRKGHIREEELARVFNYDRTVSENIETICEAMKKTQSHIENENWADTPTDVKRVKSLLIALEDKWRERKKLFRPIEI